MMPLAFRSFTTEFSRTHYGIVLMSLVSAVVIAEFAGYWLHRLLHSHRVTWLSKSHLDHHFKTYPPNGALRSHEYADSTTDRFSLGNIGLEWLVPSGIILLLCFSVVHALGLPNSCQVLFLLTLLLWPVFMFSYLHDRMHLVEFWMADTPLLQHWFRQARRLHDIHHRSIGDDGRMDANFGIGFFVFDRVFCTIVKRHRPLNARGYGMARERLRAMGILEDEPAFPHGFRS